MAKKIVISAVCYCCDHREKNISTVKPTSMGTVIVKQECLVCESINTYRLSIRYGNIKVETIHCTSTAEGRDLYKKRTGKDFI